MLGSRLGSRLRSMHGSKHESKPGSKHGFLTVGGGGHLARDRKISYPKLIKFGLLCETATKNKRRQPVSEFFSRCPLHSFFSYRVFWKPPIYTASVDRKLYIYSFRTDFWPEAVYIQLPAIIATGSCIYTASCQRCLQTCRHDYIEI